MTIITRFTLILFFAIFCKTGISQNKIDILSVPAGNKPTKINMGGTTILPSGRFLTPAGDIIQITCDPFGMAVSPDGKKSVALHNGVFTIIDLKSLEAIRVPSYDNKIKSPLSKGSYLGVAFAKDSKTVYLSGGDNGAVIIYDIESLTRLDSVSLNGIVDGIEYIDSFTSDLVANEENNELLVLDRANFRMVLID
jgi:DNA-binding beta-propeller fold protein YncE